MAANSYLYFMKIFVKFLLPLILIVIMFAGGAVYEVTRRFLSDSMAVGLMMVTIILGYIIFFRFSDTIAEWKEQIEES